MRSLPLSSLFRPRNFFSKITKFDFSLRDFKKCRDKMSYRLDASSAV
jgi:hypothetical protein